MKVHLYGAPGCLQGEILVHETKLEAGNTVPQFVTASFFMQLPVQTTCFVENDFMPVLPTATQFQFKLFGFAPDGTPMYRR